MMRFRALDLVHINYCSKFIRHNLKKMKGLGLFTLGRGFFYNVPGISFCSAFSMNTSTSSANFTFLEVFFLASRIPLKNPKIP